MKIANFSLILVGFVDAASADQEHLQQAPTANSQPVNEVVISVSGFRVQIGEGLNG